MHEGEKARSLNCFIEAHIEGSSRLSGGMLWVFEKVVGGSEHMKNLNFKISIVIENGSARAIEPIWGTFMVYVEKIGGNKGHTKGHQ